MFKKLSEIIGFTETEIKVILFLLIVLAIGIGSSLLYKSNEPVQVKKIDYSKEDSLFTSAGKDEINKDNNNDKADKNIDSKQEVLDFNKRNLEVDKNNPLAEQSINLNEAGLEELANLPGIGQRTAENILSYRSKIGSFTNFEELLNVKGIGNTKLEKIKKYLFIQ